MSNYASLSKSPLLLFLHGHCPPKKSHVYSSSSCLLRHINHLSRWWVFGEGDNAKAITCALQKYMRLPQLSTLRGTERAGGMLTTQAFPGQPLLFTGQRELVSFQKHHDGSWLSQATWEKEKGVSPKPLLHFIICFFPTWRPHQLQVPGGSSVSFYY